MALIPDQRHLFDMPGDVTYLNCSYVSPQLLSERDAGNAAVRGRSLAWELQPVDFFTESERLRGLFAQLVGAQSDDVALVPSVSYGLAVAARNLRVGPGKKVVLIEDEFPSNFYVWQRLVQRDGGSVVSVERPADSDWTKAVLDVIDDSVAIVALPNCHWTDGSLVDLERVGEATRRHGAALVVDATQSLGAYPLSIDRVQPDFLVAAGYKWLLGPYSQGYLYVAPRHQGGEPLEENWILRKDSEDFRSLVAYQDEYQPGARRFDVGERSNFMLVPMALAALSQILEWGVDNVAATLAEKTGSIEARAREIEIESLPAARRVSHMTGLRVPGGVPENLSSLLAAEKIYVSVRGDSIRVSPHLYNTTGDIDRLFDVLKEYL